jgi:hypothetical protein
MASATTAQLLHHMGAQCEQMPTLQAVAWASHCREGAAAVHTAAHFGVLQLACASDRQPCWSHQAARSLAMALSSLLRLLSSSSALTMVDHPPGVARDSWPEPSKDRAWPSPTDDGWADGACRKKAASCLGCLQQSNIEAETLPMCTAERVRR